MNFSSKYWLIIPVALLVTVSQLIVKVHSSNAAKHLESSGALHGFFRFIADPVVLFAYGLAFVASLGWLYVVTKLPLSVAFPVYMATTFLFVLISGWLLLGEAMTGAKLVAISLILAGIALALNSEG